MIRKWKEEDKRYMLIMKIIATRDVVSDAVMPFTVMAVSFLTFFFFFFFLSQPLLSHFSGFFWVYAFWFAQLAGMLLFSLAISIHDEMSTEVNYFCCILRPPVSTTTVRIRSFICPFVTESWQNLLRNSFFYLLLCFISFCSTMIIVKPNRSTFCHDKH